MVHPSAETDHQASVQLGSLFKEQQSAEIYHEASLQLDALFETGSYADTDQ